MASDGRLTGMWAPLTLTMKPCCQFRERVGFGSSACGLISVSLLGSPVRQGRQKDVFRWARTEAGTVLVRPHLGQTMVTRGARAIRRSRFSARTMLEMSCRLTPRRLAASACDETSPVLIRRRSCSRFERPAKASSSTRTGTSVTLSAFGARPKQVQQSSDLRRFAALGASSRLTPHPGQIRVTRAPARWQGKQMPLRVLFVG
jgi:hypothetical protein